jgi:hypothetical protein
MLNVATPFARFSPHLARALMCLFGGSEPLALDTNEGGGGKAQHPQPGCPYSSQAIDFPALFMLPRMDKGTSPQLNETATSAEILAFPNLECCVFQM